MLKRSMKLTHICISIQSCKLANCFGCAVNIPMITLLLATGKMFYICDSFILSIAIIMNNLQNIGTKLYELIVGNGLGRSISDGITEYALNFT